MSRTIAVTRSTTWALAACAAALFLALCAAFGNGLLGGPHVAQRRVRQVDEPRLDRRRPGAAWLLAKLDRGEQKRARQDHLRLVSRGAPIHGQQPLVRLVRQGDRRRRGAGGAGVAVRR